MAKAMNRAGGHVIPAVVGASRPEELIPQHSDAAPATSVDPNNGPAHPHSRRPDAPGHGGSGGNK